MLPELVSHPPSTASIMIKKRLLTLNKYVRKIGMIGILTSFNHIQTHVNTQTQNSVYF